MRSFNNFLKEATETSASRQAKLLGLVGDGHGGWYDAKGKFVAKTEKGKLRFYGQGGAKPEDEKVGKNEDLLGTAKMTINTNAKKKENDKIYHRWKFGP